MPLSVLLTCVEATFTAGFKEAGESAMLGQQIHTLSIPGLQVEINSSQVAYCFPVAQGSGCIIAD